MDLSLGVAMLIGIGPALALLYFGVRNYTYPRVEQPFFSDPTFFTMFVVGLVEGVVLSAALWGFGFLSNLIFMVLFGVIQVLAMVVVMNLRRFRGKSDSVFYGYAVGLGQSSGLASGLCFYSLAVAGEVGYDLQSIVFLVVMSVSMSLLVGACGTNVGEGIARHRVMEFALQALLLVVIYDLLLFGVIQWSGNIVLYAVALIVMLVVAVYYYRRIMYEKLPQIVREVLKMEGKKRSDLPKN